MSAIGTIRSSARSMAKSLPKGHSNFHIKLVGLPRTATPADITRLLAKNKIHNVIQVTLDYDRFEPSGRAFITLSQPSVLQKALVALGQLRYFGHPLSPWTTQPPSEIRMRSRGLKGREEASERSIITGNGSQGGITDGGRSVLLSGLPGKITTEAVRRYLRKYKLMGGQGDVVKLESDFRGVMASRTLVRLSSPSEAFRLVRNMHMTNFEPRVWEDKYTIRAHVVH